MSGAQIVSGLKQLYQFQQACCKQAKTPADLKQAGNLFADAVGKIGVNTLLAILSVRELKGTSRGAVLTQSASRVATEPNQAFFWSGRSRAPDGTLIGGEEAARAIAKSSGGTTLESLIEQKGIKLPEWDPNDPSTIQA